MKRFKVMAASVALMIGASGAAFAQRAEHNNQTSTWQQSYRVAPTASAHNYEAARNDRTWNYQNGAVRDNDVRRDNDDMTAGYGRYTANPSRYQDRDGDDWQYATRAKYRDPDHDRDLRSGVRQSEHGRNDRIRFDRDRY